MGACLVPCCMPLHVCRVLSRKDRILGAHNDCCCIYPYPIGRVGMSVMASTIAGVGSVCPAVELLDLYGQRLLDAGGLPLSQALSRPLAFPKLQIINLCRNAMGDEGIRHLAEALGRAGAMPCLTNLDLSHNVIGPEGTATLAEATQQPGALQALRTLSLEHNKVGDQGLVALADALVRPTVLPSLTALDVQRVGAGDAGASGLANACWQGPSTPTLGMVQLDDDLGDEALVAWAGAVRRERGEHEALFLSLRGPRAGEAGARALAEALLSWPREKLQPPPPPVENPAWVDDGGVVPEIEVQLVEETNVQPRRIGLANKVHQSSLTLTLLGYMPLGGLLTTQAEVDDFAHVHGVWGL
jgi:hypothetical protein